MGSAALPYVAVETTTNEFGAQWVSFTAQQALPVVLQGVTSIQDVVDNVTRSLGLGCVEVIAQTQEAIFAGTDLSSGTLALLHAKKGPTGADIIVKSLEGATTARLAQECQRRLR